MLPSLIYRSTNIITQLTVSSILASLMQYPRNNNNIRGQRKDQHPRSRRLNDRFEDDK